MILLTIGEKIKKTREQLNISQESLAKSIGTSRTFISYIENGSKTPSLSAIINIAIALNSSIDDLVGLEQIREDFWNEQLRKEV